MRCNCLKCINNDDGYCCASIEIDEDGECDSLLIPDDRGDDEK